MIAEKHANRASQILSHQIGSMTLQLAHEQARGDVLAGELAEVRAELEKANAELAALREKKGA